MLKRDSGGALINTLVSMRDNGTAGTSVGPNLELMYRERCGSSTYDKGTRMTAVRTYTFKVEEDCTVNGHVFDDTDAFNSFLARLNELAEEAPTIDRATAITADEFAIILTTIEQAGKKGANMADIERELTKTFTNKAKADIKAMLHETDGYHASGSPRTYINRWVATDECPRNSKRNPWGHVCCGDGGWYKDPMGQLTQAELNALSSDDFVKALDNM